MSAVRRQPLTVIVLATDAGTRMRSPSRPKVLHAFAGRSLLGHVLAAIETLQPTATAVVLGPGAAEVRTHLEARSNSAETADAGAGAASPPQLVVVEQPHRPGAVHSIRAGLEQLRLNADAERVINPGLDSGLDSAAGLVLVLPADVPLLRGVTLRELVQTHTDSGAAATFLSGAGTASSTGAGSGHGVAAAASVCLFDGAALAPAVSGPALHLDSGDQLAAVLELLSAQGHRVRDFSAPASEIASVADQVGLAEARRTLNDRLLTEHMLNGVTVVDPATTWVDVGVVIEAEAIIRPHTQLEGTTRIAAGAIIGPDCTLTDTEVGAGSHLRQVVANQARIGAGVTVGPYAYLRPGTQLADEVHVGTFVEIKASDVGVGSKVPHLTYVGDASIGRHSNIGASSVFVNYDGVAKHRSSIGSYARTGADNMFVAPVSVGDGAYTAAGSVIAEDVPPGALAVARARQRNIPDWVARSRAGTPADEAAQAAQAAQAAEGQSAGLSEQPEQPEHPEQPEQPEPKMAEPPLQPASPNSSAPPRETETPER